MLFRSLCHPAQQAFFTGQIEGLTDAPVSMPDKDCASCHGEPPDIVIPPSSMCVLCHEPGYDEKLGQWRSESDELRKELEEALAAAAPAADPQALASARRALALVGDDGSRGVHNIGLSERLLSEALARLATR